MPEAAITIHATQRVNLVSALSSSFGDFALSLMRQLHWAGADLRTAPESRPPMQLTPAFERKSGKVEIGAYARRGGPRAS